MFSLFYINYYTDFFLKVNRYFKLFEKNLSTGYPHPAAPILPHSSGCVKRKFKFFSLFYYRKSLPTTPCFRPHQNLQNRIKSTIFGDKPSPRLSAKTKYETYAACAKVQNLSAKPKLRAEV
jgi:hypothetical protein